MDFGEASVMDKHASQGATDVDARWPNVLVTILHLMRIHDGGRCVKRTTGIKGSFRPVAQWKSITGDGIAIITPSSMKHPRDRDSPSASLSISVRRVLDESQSLTVSQIISDMGH
jgi:hypothetical protein